jgi:hypothetical protein
MRIILIKYIHIYIYIKERCSLNKFPKKQNDGDLHRTQPQLAGLELNVPCQDWLALGWKGLHLPPEQGFRVPEDPKEWQNG